MKRLRDQAWLVVGWIFQNPHFKLLSAFLAIGMWLYVQGEDVVKDQVLVKVRLEKPGDLIETEPLLPTVVAYVEGSRSAVQRARTAEGTLVVDLSESTYRTEPYTVEFDTFEVEGLPANVVVTGFTPSSTTVTLDRLIQHKVTVRIVTVGIPEAGNAVVATRAEPGVVDIAGPRSVVEGLVDVVTQPVDVSALRHDQRIDIGLQLPRGVQSANPPTVKAVVNVEPLLETRVFPAVPLSVWRHDNWIAVPGEVRVKLEGPASQLRRIAEQEVAAYVYLPEVTNQQRYVASFVPGEALRARVVIPGSELVKVAEVKPATVEVFRK